MSDSLVGRRGPGVATDAQSCYEAMSASLFKKILKRAELSRMLYYSQIKREFKKLTWKRGQTYFRDERVSDVRLDGDRVMGKVKGSDNDAYETALVMARGTILNSKCSCPAHRAYEDHCKHVAALAIWLVERVLLRSCRARVPW